MLIDAHAHLALQDSALQSLLGTMNRLGISQAMVVGGGLLPPNRIGSSKPHDVAVRKLHFDHRRLLELCEAHDHLFPFYFANPWESPNEYRELGPKFAGLKLGPAVHGAPLLSAETRRYVEIAEKIGHPVYLHCLNRDGFRVSHLTTLAGRYPRIQFILGHGGIGHLDYTAVDCIAPAKNISYETSGAFKSAVRYAVDVLGADRVLFGSEFPLQSASAEIEKIRDLSLSDEEFHRVTYSNAKRLLQGRAA